MFQVMNELEKAEVHIEEAFTILLENTTDTKLTELALHKLIKLLKKQGKSDKIKSWKNKISTNSIVEQKPPNNDKANMSLVPRMLHSSAHNLEVPSMV